MRSFQCLFLAHRPSHVAARAYKQAMATLSYLKAHDTPAPPSSFVSAPSASKFMSSFLPNLQGQGPTGSFLRILFKLFQMSFGRLFNILSQDVLFSFSKERTEELKGKAIKVVDLLEHSAELGNMDALYALAQISLVFTIYSLAFQASQILICSFLLQYMYHSIHVLHTSPSMSMHPELEMQHRSPCWLSFMPLAIKESCLWIKGKPNYMPRSLLTEATRGLRCS